MFRHPKEFDRYTMIMANQRAQGMIKSAVKYANLLTQDPDREKRVEVSLCKPCFYSVGMGGAAITTQPCACCEKPQVYSSTNTDALCLECAQEHSLCKHCMGDLFNRAGRSKWPVIVEDLTEATPLQSSGA